MTRPGNRIALAHATAVLPDRVQADALVLAEDGVITDVAPITAGLVPPDAIDVRGALVLPGLIDTHSDGLEKEIRPRPGAEFDIDFAVCGFEGRVRAAGVTTLFHGIGFQGNEEKGRSVQQARRVTGALRRRRESGHAIVDHRLLLRVDARDPEALTAVRGLLDAEPGVPLISYEDHTPGQGQFHDVSVYRNYIQGTQGLTDAEADEHVVRTIRERGELEWHRPVALEWLGRVSGDGRAVLLAHDPATADEITQVYAHGARVAEFPTTLEAARAARAAGMHVVAGAPNVLRGGSHSGNVAASALIAEGLVDALSSDYLPTSLLAAVLMIERTGLATLPEAVRLVTGGPAALAGLTDRGRLEAGARADLLVATLDGVWPTARLVHRADDLAAGELGAERTAEVTAASEGLSSVG